MYNPNLEAQEISDFNSEMFELGAEDFFEWVRLMEESYGECDEPRD